MSSGPFRQHKQAILVLLIILLGFALYANSLQGQFIWDDTSFIKNNAYVKDWSKLIPVFTRDSGAGSSTTLNFYRPLQLFTYMIDHSLWGLNVIGYHLTNVALHILVGLAVYRLVLLIFASLPLAFFSAVLFVAHPVHTEAVSYLSGRGDPLSALFILLCLIFYIQNTRSPGLRRYILMVASCLLAFLSKENALIITPLLLLYHYIFREKIRWRLLLAPLLISMVYLFGRAVSLRSFFFGPEMLIKRVPGFFAAIAGYLKVLLLPEGLHMEYGNRLFALSEPRVIFGLVVFLSFLILAFRKREVNRLVAFGILWFFIALLPTTSIYPVHSFYMAEHWLYLPSVGFFLILGQGLASLYKKKNFRFAAISLLILLLSAYSYLTVKQNSYWRSEVGFYKRTLEYSPGSYMAHNNLGNIYTSAGDYAAGMKEYLKAIELNPKFTRAYCNLGNLYSRSGDPESGIKMYLKAIEVNPAWPHSYFFLSNAYLDLGKREKSAEAMRKAVALDPAYLEDYNNLAADYADKGNIDEALRLWNEMVGIDPGFAVAHFNLSVYYFKRKQYALALEHCDKVLELGYQVDPGFLKKLEPYRK